MEPLVADASTPVVLFEHASLGRAVEVALLEGLVHSLPERGSALVVRGVIQAREQLDAASRIGRAVALVEYGSGRSS